MVTLTIYVPTERSGLRWSLLPGTAIVGSPEGDQVRMSAEATLSALSVGYPERLAEAARKLSGVVAPLGVEMVPAAELEPVGTCDVAGECVSVTNWDSLQAWCEDPALEALLEIPTMLVSPRFRLADGPSDRDPSRAS